MRTWSILLVVVLVLGVLGALVGLGVFAPDPATDPSGDPVGNGTGEGEAEEEALLQLYGPSPKDRPEIQTPEIKEDLGVLLLVGAPQRFNAFLAQQWSRLTNVRIRSWVAPLPRAPAGTGPPPAERLPGALASPPNASLLDDENIGVLVLNDIDPTAVDDEFWREVVKRVEEGRLGLLVIPDMLHGRAMFEHPMVGPLLPVTSIQAIEGQPTPGIFGRVEPFAITGDGASHPASRLVPWPTWSRALWNGTRTGEAAWGTRFCMPVDGVAEGALTLLKADPARRAALPALIAGPNAKGRVLWFGARELGVGDTYGRPSVVRDWDALIGSWLAWLGGQLEK